MPPKKRSKKRVSVKTKRPIVTCVMCRKHVTKQMEVRYKGKAYCCTDCAEACQRRKK